MLPFGPEWLSPSANRRGACVGCPSLSELARLSASSTSRLQATANLIGFAPLGNAFDHQLSGKCDQHADNDDPDFAGELASSV